MSNSKLFEPWWLGKLKVRNRIVMAPMGSHLGTEDGSVSERMVSFYEERARGGAGLIVTENTCVEWPRGKASTFPLRTDVHRAVTGLHDIAERVHYYKTLVATQLQHAGGQTTLERTENVQPYAPSAIPIKGNLIPKEMTHDDIKHVICLFAKAAKITKDAGFDCVEIHGAHGYLVSQFLSPVLNFRKDEYGGDLKGRTRFAVELVKGMRESVGKDFAIIFRMNGSDRIKNGTTIDDVKYIARALEEAGIDAISVSSGLNGLSRDWVFPTPIYPSGCNTEFSKAIKEVVKIPVGVAGRIDSPAFAEEIIQKGMADFIVLGRPLIADPDWSRKAFLHVSEQIRPCIYCNNGCTKQNNKGWRISCSINPEAGRELEWQIKQKPARPLHLGIVGGGPAGMEAACRACLRGHSVELFEKEDSPGGQLHIASRPVNKEPLDVYSQFLVREMARLGVKTHFSTLVTNEMLSKLNFDGVIVATGAVCNTSLKIEGIEYTRSAWDVLKNGIEPSKNAVVLGGGEVGVDTAVYLSMQQPPVNITIIEMLPEIIPDAETGNRMALIKLLKEKNIEIMTSTTVCTIKKDKATIKNLSTGAQEDRPADLVVLAIGALSKPLELDEKSIPYPVIYIGDCYEPRTIWEATHEAAYAILQLENLVNP